MRRIAPSTRDREELRSLFTEGADRGTNILSELSTLGLRYLAQQALEEEQADFLGRDRYERTGDPRGHRNGYERARVHTAEGAIDLQVPQVRGSAEPFHPRLLEFVAGNSEVLDQLVTEMYARGLSTRDVEDCFRDATGELMISKSAVTAITDRLWEEYQAFSERDLSDIDIHYLFVDAIYESLRRHGAKEGVLVAWCITGEGRKILLHLAVGNKESEACWTEFFRSMLARGLRQPTTVTSDGAPGLINALRAAFPLSVRIRCWFHKLGNIRAKLPAEGVADLMAHLRAVRDAPTYDAGRAMAADVIAKWGETFPAAIRCFTDDLEASLGHLHAPARHRIHVRTTNLIERSFVEERRRTKVIPRLLDERSAMKLVFATLIRCSARWSRLCMSELERQQLLMLRRELGLDPPPTGGEKEKTRRKQKAA